MIQITIFAGHEGEMRYDKAIYFTVFGGCTLIKPTVARQIMIHRQHGDAKPARRKPFFLTLFGGTEIKSPTLAAEFIDMREMINGGTLSMEDWDRTMSEAGRFQDSVGSLTLFGSFEESTLPTEAEEIDSLAIQCHLGNVHDSARRILQTGIGQGESERRAILRRAIQDTA